MIRLDPATGQQTAVSTGGLLQVPWGIAIEDSGDILIADAGQERATRAV
jgi:hypothetical protein